MIFRRFFAFMIDKLIITFIAGILGFFIGLAILFFVQKSNQSYFVIPLIIIFYLFIPFYYSYFESSEMQGTPGKKILDIQIVDIYGNRLDGTEAFIRVLAAFFINMTVIGFVVSVIMMIWREDGKMLHDIFLNTKVARR